MTGTDGGEIRRTGRRRWTIAYLLGAGVIVSYADRVVLATAAPAIEDALQLDDLTFGLMLSAFGWTYGLCQIPAGLLLDRHGVRRVMIVAIALWTGAALLAGLAAGPATLFAARALLGIAEAPAFPANAKAVGAWFPRQERSLATACFDGAAKFANVVAIPAVAGLCVVFGWRWAFFATAMLSLAYWVLFFTSYRHPDGDRRLGSAERGYIRNGGGGEAVRAHGGVPLRSLLSKRQILGLCLGFGCHSYAFSFFIGWLPTYVARASGTSTLGTAALTAVPWLGATASNLLMGGWLIDGLVKAGWNEIRVRQAVIGTGLLLALAITGAALTDDFHWQLFWLTLSLSGLAAASPALWSLPALVAPHGAAATVSGVMNFCGSLMGVAASLSTGLILQRGGSFAQAMLVVGWIVVGGIIAITALLGGSSTGAHVTGTLPEISD